MAQETDTTKKINRKPLNSATCKFNSSWWNDSEMRNYSLHNCSNSENTGGKPGMPFNRNRHD